MNRVWKQMVAEIGRAPSFFLSLHQSPDGDSIGSNAALARGLHRLGKDVALFHNGDVPGGLAFLMEELPVPALAVDGDHLPAVSDRVGLITDASSADRLGAVEPLLDQAELVISIDHHPGHTGFADLNYCEPETGSVCELVYDLLNDLSLTLDEPTAYALFTGIATDTGFFRYEKTRASTFRKAAALLEAGVRPERVVHEVEENRSLASLRLEQASLRTLKLTADNQVAFMITTQSMLSETGATEDDASGLINIPRRLSGVEVVVHLKEQADGTTRVSFRSKQRVDVGQLARRLGGGGHARASGWHSPDSPAETKDRISSELEQVMD